MIPPLRYKDAKYEDVPEDIRAKFEKMKDTRRGLYIHGEVGTGKTHIAMGLMAGVKEKLNVNTKMWNMTELLREMRLDFDRNAYDKAHAEEEIMDFKGLLILDDVGAEKISDWVAETFYLILNRRYNEMLPMVITSNLPITTLADRIGDRSASRIIEMCDIVEIVGVDRRIKSQNKTQVEL